MDPELSRYFESQRLTFVHGWRNPIKQYCHFHQHPVLEIVYHVRGHGATTLGSGTVVPFARHSVVIYPPRMLHDQKMEAPGEDACIHIGTPAPLPPLLTGCVYVESVHDAYLVNEISLLTEPRPKLTPLDHLSYDLRAAAVLIQLLQSSTRKERYDAQASAAAYAEQAYDYIQNNFHRIGRVETVAERVNVSYDYLRHVFKQRYGFNLKRWLMVMRLEQAKKLLAHSPLPQKAISSMCGFDNERYFSTNFKKMVGQTPGEFRSKTRNAG